MESLTLRIVPPQSCTNVQKPIKCAMGIPHRKKDPIVISIDLIINYTRKITGQTDNYELATKTEENLKNRVIKEENVGKVIYTYESISKITKKVRAGDLRETTIQEILKEIEDNNRGFTLIFENAEVRINTQIVEPNNFNTYNYTLSYLCGKERFEKSFIGTFQNDFILEIISTKSIDEVPRISSILGRITSQFYLGTSSHTLSQSP